VYQDIMTDRHITTKIAEPALRLLRLIAASTGEKHRDVLTRLLTAEARRLGLPEQKPPVRKVRKATTSTPT
jgi:hypothetical protein